jgi:hypothetical protein
MLIDMLDLEHCQSVLRRVVVFMYKILRHKVRYAYVHVTVPPSMLRFCVGVD